MKETRRRNIAKKALQSVFFMEPDHEEVRTNEDLNTQEYWEAGITTESLSALKAGNVDHSQKLCYHCSQKGYIKGNYPEQRKSGAQSWTKRPRLKVKKTFIKKKLWRWRGEWTKNSV